jgi:SPOR domain
MSNDSAHGRAVGTHPGSFSGGEYCRWTSWAQTDSDALCARSGPVDETALAAYRRLQEKYAPILGGREPRVFHHGLARGSMGWARVHVGADSRASAEKLCGELRAAGGSCTVLRN